MNVKLDTDDARKLMHNIKRETVRERITKDSDELGTPCIIPFVLLLGFALMAIVFMMIGHEEIIMPTTDDYDKEEERYNFQQDKGLRFRSFIIGLILIIPVICLLVYLITSYGR